MVYQIEDKKAIPAKLVSFGFKKNGSVFTYTQTIVNNLFDLNIQVSKNSIKTIVIEKSSQETFGLHLVSAANGEFVGKVRKEYNDVLDKIKAQCFEMDIFKSEQSKSLLKYVSEKYGDKLEYLWDKFPKDAVLRRKDNKKWYAVLFVLSERKLGLDSDNIIDVIDLRVSPENIDKLVDGKIFFYGYHMNKKNWIAIRLIKSISTREIFSRIDESYKIAGKK